MVFETDAVRQDGSRFCVWSMFFSLSLHEKSNLRKFLKQWFGRDLNKEELEGLDLETLIHKSANIVVVHDEREDKTFANIAAILPWKGEPLVPSGKYKRVINRDQSSTSTAAPEQPQESNPRESFKGEEAWKAVIVHVGVNKDKLVAELNVEQIDSLLNKWGTRLGPTASDQDKKLHEALQKAMAQLDNLTY